MSLSSFSKMTPSEIVNFLNSGKFISPSTRELLENKLKDARLTNKFSALDEFFALISNKSSESSNKFKKNESKNELEYKLEEDFPKISDKEISSKPIIDFNKLNIINTNEQNDNFSLFVDNKLLIDYQDIIDLYNFFAIYRIKMYHLILNRKIHIFDSLQFINPSNATIFKMHYNYHYLFEKELEIKKCLEIIINLNNLIYILESISIIFKSQNSILDFKKQSLITEKITNLEINYDYLMNILENDHQEILKHLDVIKQITTKIKEFIFYLLSNDFNDKLITENYLNDINNSITNTHILIDKIIKNYDPHINCDYYIEFNNNINEKIIPLGLSTYCYLDCNDEINLKTNNTYLSNDLLQNITIEDLDKILNKKIYKRPKYFINIWIPDEKIKQMYINYYINTILNFKGYVQINNLPKNCGVLTSTFGKSVENDNLIIPTEPTNTLINNWLNSRIKNEIYAINRNEFNSLNPSFTKNYRFSDTNKNSFVVDYVFNELLKNDSHYIVNQGMFDSFKELAYYTSNIN